MQTFCITGAGRGLGFALTRHAFAQGERIFAGCYPGTEDVLKALATEEPHRLQTHTLDISDDASVLDFSAFVQNATESIDVLINNAGILGNVGTRLGGEIDFRDIVRVFNVNAVGPLRVISRLMPMLREGSLVVNISSSDASISDCSRRDSYGYCISKAALNMMSAIASNDLRERGIECVNIHPGWMKTFMTGTLDTQGDLTADQAAGKLYTLICGRNYAKQSPLTFVDNEGKRMRY